MNTPITAETIKQIFTEARTHREWLSKEVSDYSSPARVGNLTLSAASGREATPR